MKKVVKSLIKNLEIPIDTIFCIVVVPAAYLMLIFRKIGASRLPKTSKILKKIGIFPIRDHYYEPFFNDQHLIQPLNKNRELPGLELNTTNQLNFIKKLNYFDELNKLNWKLKEKTNFDFNIENGSFESGDAEFLYQFIRKVKPKKVIEIGSGSSTKIAQLAIKENFKETGVITEHICIEPYEQPWLKDMSGITLIRERIEKINYDWSSKLDDGDLLFVDSSHIIRPQGDVLKEYLEIFPKLSKGVFVHIHDIFTPKDYLKSWVINDVRFWNEQYLLEAMLSNTDRYEVIAALNYLKHNFYNELLSVCPYLTQDREPGSFYFRVKK
jgi:hypothetical protein